MSVPLLSGPVRIVHRLALCGFVIGSITLASGLAHAPAAVAHDELLSTSPLDGDVLSDAPSSIDLVFSADVLDVGTAVIVVDASSTDRAAGEPELAGTTLTQPLEDLPDGSYEVRWRVVSSDGHPIAGAFEFIVGDPAAAEPVPRESLAQLQPPAASGGTTRQDPTAVEAVASDAQPAGSFWSSAPLWQIAALGGVLGLGVYALVLRLRRGRP